MPRPTLPPSRPSRGRHSGAMFAACAPGLLPLLQDELVQIPGISLTSSGDDGRAGLALFDAAPPARPLAARARLADHVFVEVARTSAGGDAAAVAERLWPPASVERALSMLASTGRPMRAAMTFRVVVRVRQEREFLRTDLRGRMASVIGRSRPRWRNADPAALEVWALERAPGEYICGLRLTPSSARDRRPVERPGSLSPAVATAMVRLAGPSRGALLDPCCGSGTVLSEALSAGWQARGIDLDPAAVAAATVNVPRAEVGLGDVRALALSDASVGACVSNLPFGRQYAVQGERTAWLRSALAEMARVTRPGGRVVVLVPDLRERLLPPSLRPVSRYPIVLRGMHTVLAAYDRVA